MAAPASAEAPDAYEALLEEYDRKANLENATRYLQWDQEVMMPDEGTAGRARQRSAVSGVVHETISSDAIQDALAALADASLSPERAAVVREVEREHRRARAVPTPLVEELSEAASDALPKWREARENDEFDTFAPALSNLVELNREYAAAIDSDRDPYEVLFEEYEPYLGIDTAERVLTELRENLVPLIEAVGESDVTLPRPFDGTYDVDGQEAAVRDALDLVGYDWDRGRLDTGPHPFSTGTQFDARIVTRFDETDLLAAVTSTLHEFGHASYTLGLPDDAYGTPLGEDRDLTVHESQSRFWENHVCRSRPFWELFLPALAERFPPLSGVSPEEAYAAANRVYDDNPIRVEADELTYHMHIVLRFEIERDLIRGDLDVEEVPAVWNDKMESYLGIRPETDTEGCLQDIHWSHGSFGYFPTYSLGSVLAAQVDGALRRDVGEVDALVREGEFAPVREWLTEHVHRHGKRYETDDLVREATGDSLSADAFVEHVEGKYGDLYDL